MSRLCSSFLNSLLVHHVDVNLKSNSTDTLVLNYLSDSTDNSTGEIINTKRAQTLQNVVDDDFGWLFQDVGK